jgi:hypothetical protein
VLRGGFTGRAGWVKLGLAMGMGHGGNRIGQEHLATSGFGRALVITSGLTIDGGTHDEFIDLRGLPSTSWSPAPIHGNGATDRSTLTHNFAAMHFASAGSGCRCRRGTARPACRGTVKKSMDAIEPR